LGARKEITLNGALSPFHEEQSPGRWLEYMTLTVCKTLLFSAKNDNAVGAELGPSWDGDLGRYPLTYIRNIEKGKKEKKSWYQYIFLGDRNSTD
jgi:hypothetical protein